MNEKTFTKRIREKCSNSMLQFRSFESFGNKVPDLLVVSPRGVFWLEAKVATSMYVKVPFEKGQIKWMLEWERDGGSAAIVVSVFGEGMVFIPFVGNAHLLYEYIPLYMLLGKKLASRVETLGDLALTLELYAKERGAQTSAPGIAS